MRAEEARRLTEESKLIISTIVNKRHQDLTFEEIIGVIEYSSRQGYSQTLLWGRISEEVVVKLENLGYRVAPDTTLGGPSQIDWDPQKD